MADLFLLAILLALIWRHIEARAEHRELMGLLNALAEMLGEEIDRRKGKEQEHG